MAAVKPLSRDGVKDLLEREVDRLGSQKALAFKMEVSQQYLSDVLLGRRPIGPAILNYFALRPHTVYVPDDGREAA